VTAARLPRLPCNETPSEIGNSERGADNLSAGAHNMRVPTDPRLVKKLRDWRAAVNSGADSPHSKSWSHHNLQWEQPACEEEQAPAQETETEPEEPQSAWTGSREELASPSVWDLKRRAWEVGREYPVIDGCLSFLILPGADQPGSGQPNDVYVTSEWPELYEHMGEGFGPVNLGVVHAFCNWMEKKFRQHQKEERHSGETRKIVYYLAENTAHQTNAAFLIASYLLIKMKWTPAQAWAPFGCIKPSPFAKYPAASLDEEASEEGFHLPVLACLQGVAMAIHRGLYLPETFDDNVYSQVGRRDAEDLHYCTPTLAAFSAPSKTSEKVSPWASSKTAADYAPLFAARGIRDVVTLSEDSDDYPEKAFTAHGVRHRSLSFPEYGHPPCEVVEDFVALMRAAPGAVAVHCSDGRGRTGELLGVYLMIHHRCSASEALGWLRVVRPGSVPKGGEDYLFWAEEMLAGGRPLRDPPLANQARRARLEANVRKMRSTVVGERFVARMRSDQVYRTHEREGERLVNFLTGEEEEEELQETGGGLMQPPLDLIAKC